MCSGKHLKWVVAVKIVVSSRGNQVVAAVADSCKISVEVSLHRNSCSPIETISGKTAWQREESSRGWFGVNEVRSIVAVNEVSCIIKGER